MTIKEQIVIGLVSHKSDKIIEVNNMKFIIDRVKGLFTPNEGDLAAVISNKGQTAVIGLQRASYGEALGKLGVDPSLLQPCPTCGHKKEHLNVR